MSKCGEKWPRDMRKNAVDQRLLPFRGVHLIERKTLSFSSFSEERERERRDRSTFMRIFSTELLKANLHFNVHNIFVLYYNTVFVQNGQNEN